MFLYIIVEPCQYIKYEATTLSYDEHSDVSIIHRDKSAGNKSKENGIKEKDEVDRNQNKKIDYRKDIYFYYSTTTVKLISVDKMLNFSNFISAIGGNLGLFVGFSFLGDILCLYSLIKRIYNRHNLLNLNPTTRNF